MDLQLKWEKFADRSSFWKLNHLKAIPGIRDQVDE